MTMNSTQPCNSFQCVDDKQNLESCKGCGRMDFQMSKTQENSIVCVNCGRFHKQLQPNIKSAKEVLDKMFDFARRHGE